MRLIKDGIYVKKKYGQDTYLIKAQISDADRIFAKKENREERLIPWDYSGNVTIHSVNLLGQRDPKEFPPILNEQKELWYLAMPSQLVNKLNEAPFIKELRGLLIDGGNLKLKKDIIFENILSLNIDGSISFKKENLPNLRSLSCKYNEDVLLELYRYTIFDKLTLTAVNDNIFEKISQIKDLYGLQILRGKIDNIDNISSIKSLHWLSLNDLPKLTDLSGLTEIKELEHLTIGYCKHIKDWDFLLALDGLQTLQIPVSSFKDLPPQSIVNTLVEKGVKGITRGS